MWVKGGKGLRVGQGDENEKGGLWCSQANIGGVERR